MIKFFSSALMLVSFCFFANAQQYLKQPNLSNRHPSKKVTFWDMEKAFNEYWKDKERGENESENAEEGGYEQFKRWEWFVKQRTFPSGNFPSPEILFSEHQKYKNAGGYQKGFHTTAANWSFIGPGVVPGNGGGSGRLNCMAFHPSNPNTIFVGAACGGLWKSTDGGATWSTSNTDLLPSLSISDIVIDPTNPQIIYLATGDKYGIYFLYEVWGHYSAGVLKSTDGGLTWNQTGMNYTLSNNALIQRLILDPTNTNVLFAATNSGIFKTTDAGTTWNNIRSGSFYDIEFKPGNTNTIYAGDSIGVIRTTNGGATWNYVSGVISADRTSIAVTTDNPNAVYVWSSNGLWMGGNFYYSNNSGVSFVTRTDPSGNASPFGYYDMVLEVSPINQNIVFTGGVNTARSTNGGITWQTVSDWSSWPNPNYAHADQKAFLFAPGSSTTIFTCNDGGIFKSTDQGNTWTDLSAGIDIKQYYRMGSSFLTPTLIYAGSQDNGTDKITGLNTATRVYGADGEECLVDFTDDNIVFISTQGGNFLMSTDGGVTFNSMSAFGCDWTSPLIMDPNNNNVMYMGSSSVEKSTNNGITWNTLSGPFDGTCMYSLEISPSNSNYVYAATFGNIYRTTNGGTSWTNITGTLPVSSAAISGITINGLNPDAAWVTFSGFSAGNKIYYTSDGGNTWANVSGTLPNIPVNCIEYQNGSNDIVYIGTDLGVFYTDATMNNWLSYNTNLPNIIIDELEVYYPTSKLRAATFGRGLWESDLNVSTLQNLDASVMSMVYPPTSTCDTVIAPIVKIRNVGINTLTSVDLKYKMDSQSIQTYNWTGSLVSFATANITLPTYTFTSGTYTLTAYTSNPNASTDQNNLNDTIIRTFSVFVNLIDASPVNLVYPIQTCDTVIAPIVQIQNMTSVCINTMYNVELHYRIDTAPWQVYNWNGSLPNLASANITLPVYTLAAGTHTVYAYTANPNSSPDLIPANDTLIATFTILGNPVAIMSVQEGFVPAAFPPANWQLENSTNLWSRDNTVGGYNLSANSAMADFYFISIGTDKIITPYFDFKNLLPPIRLYFDVAYATFDISYIDSLVVDLYDDCSMLGKRIYAKGSNTLATAPPTFNPFVPTASEWRTDTINLDTMAGKDPMHVRFIAISGYGNQLYIDNINLMTTVVGVNEITNDELQITIFPNPTSGQFTVQLANSQQPSASIKIYNVFGEKVYERTDDRGQTSAAQQSVSVFGHPSSLIIDLSSQPEGIYFVKVQGNDFVKTKKVAVIK